jgi:hypothetical protein
MGGRLSDAAGGAAAAEQRGTTDHRKPDELPFTKRWEPVTDTLNPVLLGSFSSPASLAYSTVKDVFATYVHCEDTVYTMNGQQADKVLT